MRIDASNCRICSAFSDCQSAEFLCRCCISSISALPIWYNHSGIVLSTFSWPGIGVPGRFWLFDISFQHFVWVVEAGAAETRRQIVCGVCLSKVEDVAEDVGIEEIKQQSVLLYRHLSMLHRRRSLVESSVIRKTQHIGNHVTILSVGPGMKCFASRSERWWRSLKSSRNQGKSSISKTRWWRHLPITAQNASSAAVEGSGEVSGTARTASLAGVKAGGDSRWVPKIPKKSTYQKKKVNVMAVSSIHHSRKCVVSSSEG